MFTMDDALQPELDLLDLDWEHPGDFDLDLIQL
jgi:hypothetical protein